MELSPYPSGWIQANFYPFTATYLTASTPLRRSREGPQVFHQTTSSHHPHHQGQGSERDLRSPVVSVKTLGPPDQPHTCIHPSPPLSGQDAQGSLVLPHHPESLSIRPYRFIKLTPSPNPQVLSPALWKPRVGQHKLFFPLLSCSPQVTLPHQP